MAFINQVFAKDENLLKLGKVYDGTVRTLQSVSGSQADFLPALPAGYSASDWEGKVLLFNNGQVKTINNVQSDTLFDVDPSAIAGVAFQIPAGTTFTVYEPSLYIDDASRIHFGRSYPSVMMTDETGIDLNFGRIRNSALPTHAHDVATKQYVDSLKLGVWNHIESFEGDGVTDTFVVTVPISMHNALVSVGGVIQKPFEAYEVQQYSGYTVINFKGDPPPLETDVTIRTTTATNVSMSAAIEEIFVATNNQSEFLLDNEVMDKYGLLISIDGVVQSTLNYSIHTTPVQVVTQNGNQIYKGNEYRILRFAEGLDTGAIVRVLNLRGKGFHHHTGTYIMLNDDTLVPNTTYEGSGTYFYDEIVNSNNTVNITHDMIASRGGLHLYANTTVQDLYINLPEMGGEYSPDQHLEVKVVKRPETANVYINADLNNYMNYEGALTGHLGGGVAYSKQQNVPAVIHLEYESFYRTWYIKYGVGLWHINANTVNYPDVEPY